jgi:ABC-type Fe3+-hydroxamate transport system substrate-binding protein
MLRFSALERADPDAWVLTEESTTTAEELRDPTSPLADIRAVAEGRIFELDPTRFGVTPELPGAIDELVAALHAAPVPLPEVTQPEDTETGTGADEGGTEGTGTGGG